MKAQEARRELHGLTGMMQRYPLHVHAGKELVQVYFDVDGDQLPDTAAEVVEVLAKFGDARVQFDTDEGWLRFDWTEPATDEDRARVEAEARAQAEADALERRVAATPSLVDCLRVLVDDVECVIVDGSCNTHHARIGDDGRCPVEAGRALLAELDHGPAVERFWDETLAETERLEGEPG